jgi:hypothetical protein
MQLEPAIEEFGTMLKSSQLEAYGRFSQYNLCECIVIDNRDEWFKGAYDTNILGRVRSPKQKRVLHHDPVLRAFFLTCCRCSRRDLNPQRLKRMAWYLRMPLSENTVVGELYRLSSVVNTR